MVWYCKRLNRIHANDVRAQQARNESNRHSFSCILNHFSKNILANIMIIFYKTRRNS